MPTAARRLALDVLLALERGRRPLADLLTARAIEALVPRERDFLHELVLGSLRGRGLLDHALAPLLERPLDEADPAARAILRLGAHQLLRLRVPARAAVHEAVQLARLVQPRAAGFVNAVLRRLARDGPPAPPDPERDPLGWLCVLGSLPAWLAERWLAALGRDRAVARARALAEAPPTAFRLNPRRADAAERSAAAGLAPQPTPIPGALLATSGRAGTLARDGLLYVQDLGSQLAARLAADLAPPASLRALDACAAPGGKTLLLADALPAARILALEPSARRAATLAGLVAGWGADNVRVLRADAARPPFSARFGLILIDAPCSGLGTLARHPDIRWRAQPGELSRHAARQRGLLRALAPLLEPGGALVYAVCSLEPEETLGPVGDLLAAEPRLEPAPAAGWADRYAVPGGWARLPERDGGDGFFTAAFLRR